MKIGVNALFLIPKEHGGAETYLLEILLATLPLYPGITFVIFTNNENHFFFESTFKNFERVKLCRLNFSAKNRIMRILREQIELPLKIKKHPVDILWSSSITFPFFSSAPQVVTIYDMNHLRNSTAYGLLFKSMIQLFVQMAARRAKAVLTISQFSKEEIMSCSSVPADKIFVTWLSAGREFASSMQTETTRPFAAPQNKPYLLCVANTYPYKNIPRLVEAFAKAAKEIPHQLILIGHARPSGEERLQAAIRKAGCASRITRLFYASKSDLLWYYQHADLFIFPSLYEGFGLPVLEAMMSGTPVLTTTKGSIPEIAADCVCYFDGENTDELAGEIKNMLNLPQEQREEIIRRAQKRALTFSWQQTAEKTVACFSSILKP